MAISGPAHAEDLVSLLRSHQAPLEIRRFAASGVLPLDAADRMRALFAVLKDPDRGIAEAARATFDAIAPDTLADFLRGADATPAEIEMIASLSDDGIVLERVVRHHNVSEETLASLARTVTGTPQEALIVNQARLLRNPSLINALFENPGLTAAGRRLLTALKEEFFEKEERRREARRRGKEKAREAEIEVAELAAEDAEETEEPGAATAPPAPERDDHARVEQLSLRIMAMSIPERVKLALTGGREERRILIGDGSKMVGLAVLRSRGVTIKEVEGYCTMRHLDQDLFRKIAIKKDWIRRAAIMLALVKNPKVPPAVSLPLIRRLPLKELRSISRDRNLPEAVRAMSRKTYMERSR